MARMALDAFSDENAKVTASDITFDFTGKEKTKQHRIEITCAKLAEKEYGRKVVVVSTHSNDDNGDLFIAPALAAQPDVVRVKFN